MDGHIETHEYSKNISEIKRIQKIIANRGIIPDKSKYPHREIFYDPHFSQYMFLI